MFNIDVEELDWGGKRLRLETGRMARQADGAVLVTYGETTVLATAVAARSEKPGIDFFPLTVNYQEKTYAAGKIPGGYFKREGRPTEKETLVSRLIDRPIRPLFPAGFRNETQVITTVLSYDLENDSDIVALIGASAALMGLWGALVHYGRRTGSSSLRKWAWTNVAYFMVFGLVMRGIDNWAHLGGFLGGWLVAWLLDPLKAERTNHVIAAIVLLAASVASIAASLLIDVPPLAP